MDQPAKRMGTGTGGRGREARIVCSLLEFMHTVMVQDLSNVGFVFDRPSITNLQ